MKNWSKHAVLIIDVQNDSLDNTTDFPDFEKNVAALLAFARENRIEVVHLRVTFKPDQSKTWVEGTPGAEVAPFAKEMPSERVFIKHNIDGFLYTDLEAYLKERGIRHVICAGLATAICVVITALSAMQRGFLTTILSDCCACKREYHDFSLCLYGAFLTDVISLDDLDDRYARWEERIGD
jgi:nicotinamidase-related amidase